MDLLLLLFFLSYQQQAAFHTIVLEISSHKQLACDFSSLPPSSVFLNDKESALFALKVGSDDESSRTLHSSTTQTRERENPNAKLTADLLFR